MTKRPEEPANYHALSFDDQVAHHVAVLRWEEAHPEIVKAEAEANRAADKIARRAQAEASIANDRRLLALWKKDGSSAARIADLKKSMAEDQAALDKEDAQERADAKWLADLGDNEPVNPDPEMPRHNAPADGVPSYELWWSALDAWEKAHPEIVAQREAEERAEYDAEVEAQHKANPEEAAANDVEDAEYVALEAKMAKRTASRLKREAKDPAAALNKAREEAQREAMDDSGEKDEARKDARSNGESWSDIKDEWEDQWIADNWDAEAEAAFLVGFWNQWLKEHGTPFPEAT